MDLFTESSCNTKMEPHLDIVMDDFISNEWSSDPDDLFSSIFNDDILKDLDAPSMNMSINEITQNLMESSERISPISSEPEFNGFADNLGMDYNFIKKEMDMSSNGSDSGLSSDHLDLDMSPDYEPLSPALSSPGPSISERGGQNSPPRYIEVIQSPTPRKINIQNIQHIKKVPPPKVIVEKLHTSEGDLMFNKGQIQLQRNGNGIQPKEVKIYRMTPNGIQTNGNKKVTIQLKNGKGGIATQAPAGTVIINKGNQGNLQGVRKLIRVQNPSNPRSILLPVSLQDVKDFRTFKIINASNLKTKSPNIKLAAANLLQQSKQNLVQKNVIVSKERLMDDSMSDHTSDGESYVFEEIMKQSSSAIESVESQRDDDDDDDDDEEEEDINNISDDGNSSYPKLILSNEEKRLLSKEGITLPSNYPLTKHEERELKRIRRKIRNKISAQDSRKRKKEYVDGLEERVKQCTEENQTLMKRIKLLQSQNHNLASQMKKLQNLLTKGTNKTAQPATCLMVLLLSMALVAVPNLKLGQNTKEVELADAVQDAVLSAQQNRRSLLFDTNEQLGDALIDEDMSLDEVLAFSGLSEQEYADLDTENDSGVPQMKKARCLVDYDVDDIIWNPGENNVCSIKQEIDFNEQAKYYQENLKNGFNIENDKSPLDLDVLDMITPKANGMFELNLDKIGAEINLIANNNVKIIIDNDGNKKINASQQVNGRKLIVQDV